MADKFVKARTNIPGCGAVSGDVIYLTDQGEVWDVVNTKLSITHNAIRVSAGVWAVLNQTKTMLSPVLKPMEFVSTKAYDKNTLIYKDSKLYRANSDITSGTAFVEGNSANQWSEVGTTPASLNGGGAVFPVQSWLWHSKMAIKPVKTSLSIVLKSVPIPQ